MASITTRITYSAKEIQDMLMADAKRKLSANGVTTSRMTTYVESGVAGGDAMAKAKLATVALDFEFKSSAPVAK